MKRYFIEVAYEGTRFAGFQAQENAMTVQGELDRALSILLREPVKTTGSSRTDAGVHAFQNFLHFDAPAVLIPHFPYKLNAILPPEIAVRSVREVPDQAHARFDASSRSYLYRIYPEKDPFLRHRGYFFPYPLAEDILHAAAGLLLSHTQFEAFSKRNTQVKTYRCQILLAAWRREGKELLFEVTANRFLRGMVRGLVGTMLQAAREKISLDDFREILEGGDNRRTDFSVPPGGLFLTQVAYPADFSWGEVLR